MKLILILLDIYLSNDLAGDDKETKKKKITSADILVFIRMQI